jgi:hypothetical protein
MSWGRTLNALERDGLHLGQWGQLLIVDRGHLGIRTKHGVREIEVPELMRHDTSIEGWIDEEMGVMLLANTSSVLVRIDLRLDEAAVVAKLEREPNDDLRFVAFHEVDHNVICLYERGVLCLDLDGTLRWKVQHSDLSARFAGSRAGVVWFASQWPPDRVGYRFGVRIDDGRSVSAG